MLNLDNDKFSLVQNLSERATRRMLDSLRKEDIDISRYLKKISENNIKQKVKEIVSNIIMEKGKNSKDQEAILKEFEAFIDDKNRKKEHVISVYLANLTLISFCFNVENDTKIVKGFNYKNYLAFVLFLIDLANMNDDDFIISDELKKIIKDEANLLEEKDFFEGLEERAEEIFENNFNDNHSSAFSFKDYIQTEKDKIVKIHWGDEANKSIHCKPLSIEKLFFV